MSRLSLILVSTSPSAPMTAVPEIRAVAGLGLEGDRYFSGKGTFSPAAHRPDHEVTLVESEKISAFAAASGLPFDAPMARRNLVTRNLVTRTLLTRTLALLLPSVPPREGGKVDMPVVDAEKGRCSVNVVGPVPNAERPVVPHPGL